MACKAQGNLLNPRSLFACQYHSCTGKQDKLDCIEDFSKGIFPVFSCTLALGLGQNWKRVQMAVHMGRGDPASIVQMVGRCGGNGCLGLAILFVEKNCRNGKNNLAYFKDRASPSDDNWMDALAITPVCLRACFSIDSLYVMILHHVCLIATH
jgi:superfamily II DNA helicase RecQ